MEKFSHTLQEVLGECPWQMDSPLSTFPTLSNTQESCALKPLWTNKSAGQNENQP